MAGIKVTIGDTEFRRRFRRLQSGVEDGTPLMKLWGEIAHESITRNFEVGGRPTAWKPLAAATIKIKGHARPLIGRTGQLRNIAVRPEQTRVLIGSSPQTKDYAAIQQKGGTAGRGRKVKIPARPYILLQSEDYDEIRAATRNFFTQLAG